MLGHFQIDMINCNIVSVIEEITLSVASYISNNNINLIFDTDVEEKLLLVILIRLKELC